MTSYGGLPVTGAAVTIGGIMFDQAWILVAGLMLVGISVAVIRLSWRRGLSVTGE